MKFNLQINMGLLGKWSVTMYPNKFKKLEKQPDYKLSMQDGEGNWVEVGAAWEREEKQVVPEPLEP